MSLVSPSFDGYPLPAFAFSVWIEGCDGFVDAAFREVSGLKAETQVEELVEGGESRFVHQLPKGVKQGRLSLKRGVLARSSLLYSWCERVLADGLGDSPTTLISPKQVEISLLDPEQMPVWTWSLTNAYPVLWELDGGFNSTKNDVAVERIELVYQYLRRLKA